MTSTKLLDVSVYQGTIDFDLVPAEYAGIIERVSIGPAGLDANRVANRDGAIRTGRLWGGYHFLLPDYDIDQQIELFWRALGDKVPPLPLIIDIETLGKGLTPQGRVDAMCRAADATEMKAGRPPMFYSYTDYFRQLGIWLERATSLKRCPLHLADYAHGESPPEGTVFAKVPLWDKPTIVQTVGDRSSRVPGIAGAVDHNVFLGTLQELRDFCGLPPLRPETPMPIVHPAVDFPLRSYGDDDTTVRMVDPPVVIVDDEDPPPRAA